MRSGEIWMELKALRKHGWSISALAREFGLSRNTIRKEVQSEAPRRYPERNKPTELTPSQLAHVELNFSGPDIWRPQPDKFRTPTEFRTGPLAGRNRLGRWSADA